MYTMNISKLAASNLALVTSVSSGHIGFAQAAHTTNTAGLPPVAYAGSRGRGKGSGLKIIQLYEKFPCNSDVVQDNKKIHWHFVFFF